MVVSKLLTTPLYRWIAGTNRKVPFLLGNCVAGFRGKVDGNEQQRLFSRYSYMKGILRNPLGCVFSVEPWGMSLDLPKSVD